MLLESLPSLPYPFRSELDRVIALEGPAAVFTLDARGQLQFDPARSRESWDRRESEMKVHDHKTCICLFRDRMTGWVQFVLVTSPELIREHPRADIRVFDSADDAVQTLQSLGSPPVVDDSLSWSRLPGSPA